MARSKSLQSITIEPPAKRTNTLRRALGDVTPAALRAARTSAQQGKPADLFAIFEHFLSMDDEIGPALESLLSACVQDTITVIPTEESDEAMRQVEVVERVLDDLDLMALAEELLASHYFGARAASLTWDALSVDGTTYQAPVTYELLPDSWIYAKRVGAEPYTTLHVGREPYHAYERGAVLLMTARKLKTGEDIDFTRMGRGFAAARFGVYSWFNVEDWAAYNEVLGIPTIVGTLLDGWGKRDKEFLEAAVFGLSSDSRAIKTAKTQIEIVERKIDGTALYKEFGETMAAIKAKLIKGENLTEGPRGSTGSFAASRTANGVRLDVAQKLCTRGEWLLNRRLLAPLLDLNFSRRLCTLQWRVRPAPDMAHELRVDETAHRLGVPLSLAEWRERYGRSAPSDDADTLQRPASTRFDPFGGG